MNYKKLLHISRPRFWIYELGPYIMGLAIVFGSNLDLWILPTVIVFLVFFTYPANIFIYGINDVYDYETDKNNPKKIAYEALVAPKDHPKILRHILFTVTPFVIYCFFVLSPQVTITLLIFLFLAGFYSAKPIRAKTKPFLDSLFSAGHYTITGVFGYLMATDILNLSPAWGDLTIISIAGLSWSIAMHAYSAIPDIKVDTEAKLNTIATYLGINKTLYLCSILYILSSGIIFFYLGPIALLLGLVYFILMILSFMKPEKIFKHYTYFPIINTICGMIIFILVFLS